MRRNGSWRRRVAAVLLLFLGLGLAGVILPGPASAIPGISDCKQAPTPEVPGRGVEAFFQPAPSAAPKAGDPFAANSTTSIYEQYGYAGLRWNTYDLGCLGGVSDPGADIDTLVGNWGLGLAVFMVSLSNGLHAHVVDANWLAPLDDVTSSVTKVVHDTIWTPWGGAALLGVVVLLLYYSARGRLSDTLRGAVWALLVLTVLAGVVNYPTMSGQYYDKAVIGTLSALDAASAGAPSPSGSGGGAAQARASLLVDKVLYQAWLRGEIGTAQGDAATRWGPSLYRAQALSYDEVSTSETDPAKRAALVEAKNQAWSTTAQQIQENDPGTYTVLQGRAGGRASAGALALFAAGTTTFFRIIADLFLAAGLVMLRILVMFFPAVAVLGVMVVFSGLVRRLANAAGAAVINVIAFGAASVLHTTIVTAALQRSSDGLGWMSLVLCLLVTVILFILCLPLLSLTSLAGTTAREGWAKAGLRGAARLATNYALHRRGTRVGVETAHPQAPLSAQMPPVDRANLRQEEQAFASDPAWDDPPAQVWVTGRGPAPVAGALTVGTATAGLSAGAGAPALPYGPTGRPGGARAGLPATPSGSGGGQVLEGRVLESRYLDPEPESGAERPDWHASNADGTVLDTTSLDAIAHGARLAPAPRPLVWDPRSGRAVPAPSSPGPLARPAAAEDVDLWQPRGPLPLPEEVGP